MCLFVRKRKQVVGLKRQILVWTNVKAGISQCSLLGKLLFSIHINDLANKLSSNAKLFAENTSLFSVAHNVANFAAAP